MKGSTKLKLWGFIILMFGASLILSSGLYVYGFGSIDNYAIFLCLLVPGIVFSIVAISLYLAGLIIGSRKKAVEKIEDYEDNATANKSMKKIYCPYCGRAIEEDAEFCKYCSASR